MSAVCVCVWLIDRCFLLYNSVCVLLLQKLLPLFFSMCCNTNVFYVHQYNVICNISASVEPISWSSLTNHAWFCSVFPYDLKGSYHVESNLLKSRCNGSSNRYFLLYYDIQSEWCLLDYWKKCRVGLWLIEWQQNWMWACNSQLL